MEKKYHKTIAPGMKNQQGNDNSIVSDKPAHLNDTLNNAQISTGDIVMSVIKLSMVTHVSTLKTTVSQYRNHLKACALDTAIIFC